MKSSADRIEPGGASLRSRTQYYARSLGTLLDRVRPRGRVITLFLGLPLSRPATITLDNGWRFRVATRHDVWAVKETCLDGNYEQSAIVIPPGGTVVDVGAGIGDFSTLIAMQRPDCEVLAFEPWPKAYALLVENLALNGVSNVRTFAEALAGHPGTLILSNSAGPSARQQTAAEPAEAGRTIPVPAVTLAQALDRSRTGRCDLLKIDCEGAEYDMLLTAGEQTLGRVGAIAMEYHDAMSPHTHPMLVAHLQRHGFEVRTRGNPVHRDLGFLYARNLRWTDSAAIAH